MTAPARMTPEREAELRALITGPPPVYNRTIILELLDALTAERVHAQQVEKRAQRWESRARYLAGEFAAGRIGDIQ